MGIIDVFKKPKKKEHRVLGKSIQDSIPYTMVFRDGTIETEPGTYTRAFVLEDINFKIASLQEQTDIFHAYESLLNSFPTGVKFQIVILNRAADRTDTMKDIRFVFQQDGLNKYRQEMNNMLLDKTLAGRKNLRQDKYLIVSVTDKNIGAAMKALDNTQREVEKSIRRISKDAVAIQMNARDRLHSLFDIYNTDGKNVFYNKYDEDKKPVFDFESIKKAGLTTKDVIGPSGMDFQANYFKMGDTYGKALFLSGVPSSLSTDFMADIADISCEMMTSMTYMPIETSKGIKMIKRHLQGVNAQIAANQKRAVSEGYTYDLISPDLAQSQKQTLDLLDDVQENDQKLFNITFTICVFGNTKSELEGNVNLVERVAEKYLCPIRTLTFQQEQGFNTALPLCLNQLEVKRLYTTQSAAVFLPYTSMELYQKEGLFYGVNKMSNNLILYSRLLHGHGNNHNGLIFGASGAGKSFAAKMEMLSVLLRNSNNRVYVIDPDEDYVKLARAMNGQVIDLAPGSQTYVNPLDMDIDYDGESDPVGMKVDYIISMIEIMLGKGRSVDPQAKSVITRCVKAIYVPYLDHIEKLKKMGSDITCDKDAMPTLSNLYNELLRQPEPEAFTVASVLEMYATGSFGTFAHRSNVKTNAEFVVYNIKNLGTGMKDLGLHVCLNDIWNQMIDNRKKDLWTWIYIDEFYLLLRSESAASFLMMVWKRARKWHGVPTGIMQNTEDLLRSADSREIINNTDFIMMMNLPKMDRSNLKELLQLSSSQLEYITNQPPGHGLIYTGKTVIPFRSEFPEGTQLYKLMDTR